LAFCKAIHDAKLEFTWEGWTHAGTIDEEMLSAMKGAGLVRLSFGIESGDQEILKVIKKNVTLDQIRNAYRMSAKVGIETRGSAMLGHPYETKASAWRTIKFVRSIKELKQIFLNIACPYPGTELYDYAVSGRGGMRLLTSDYSQYKRYGAPVIEVGDMNAKDLKRTQTLGLLYFYLTPSRIWYNVFKRAGIRAGLRNVGAFGLGIVKSFLSRSKYSPCSQKDTSTQIQ
ncbi:radical SAM protein, partial [bacterium]|nr:radical SAM protein [bacterium]